MQTATGAAARIPWVPGWMWESRATTTTAAAVVPRRQSPGCAARTGTRSCWRQRVCHENRRRQRCWTPALEATQARSTGGGGTQAGARARGHMVSKTATNVWVRQGETRTTAISHGAGFRRVSMRRQLGSTLDLCTAHTLPGKSLGTTRTDRLQRNTRGHRSSSTARTRGANRRAMQKAVVVGAG